MALTIEIKVIPLSGQQKWELDALGMLKCYLKAPPEKGKANKELVKLLAKTLGCLQQDIAIVSGLSSRKKLITITTTITYQQLLERLNLAYQQEIA